MSISKTAEHFIEMNSQVTPKELPERNIAPMPG